MTITQTEIGLSPYAIADVLDDGADYIERYGWQRYTNSSGFRYGDPGCALAGIAAVEGRVGNLFYQRTPAVVALAAWLPSRDVTFAAEHAVFSYNDMYAPDAQHMLDLMRGAAKAQRRLGDRGAA